MADKKKMPVTMEQLYDLIMSHKDESKVQNEQIIFKMESILTRNIKKDKQPAKAVVAVKNEEKVPELDEKPKAKKTKAKSNQAKNKEPPATYTNSMYWFCGMVALDDLSVKDSYTTEEFEKAKTAAGVPKADSTEYDRRKCIGLEIWKTLDQQKKTALKAAFGTWSDKNKLKDTKDLEKETDTEDAEIDKEVGDDE
jgi:hypothetical protein